MQTGGQTEGEQVTCRMTQTALSGVGRTRVGRMKRLLEGPREKRSWGWGTDLEDYRLGGRQRGKKGRNGIEGNR